MSVAMMGASAAVAVAQDIQPHDNVAAEPANIDTSRLRDNLPDTVQSPGRKITAINTASALGALVGAKDASADYVITGGTYVASTYVEAHRTIQDVPIADSATASVQDNRVTVTNQAGPFFVQATDSSESATYGTDFTYFTADGLSEVQFKTSKAMTVGMVDASKPTTAETLSASDVAVHLTLSGVNIDIPDTYDAAPAALQMLGGNKDNTLTLAGDTENRLVDRSSNGVDASAGVTFNGNDSLYVQGADYFAGIYGSGLTFNGGRIEAHGGVGAVGIDTDSDFQQSGAEAGDYVVNDGTITAVGGNGVSGTPFGDTGAGAGFGGGSGSNLSGLTINGGHVTVLGGKDGKGSAAGIGGGYLSTAKYVTINGGWIDARAGSAASDAIGKSQGCADGNALVYITGGAFADRSATYAQYDASES